MVSSLNHRFSGTSTHQTNTMQRVLIALYLAAASAFAPQQLTQNRLVRLQVNPIDIYSTAAARNRDFVHSWERQ